MPEPKLKRRPKTYSVQPEKIERLKVLAAQNGISASLAVDASISIGIALLETRGIAGLFSEAAAYSAPHETIAA